MGFTVCIPTAGTGSRLGLLTKSINKSLVTVANQPVITRIINQFPEDARFVIALGFQGELVRKYLEIAHGERDITFVDVFPYEGVGSGLGLSIQKCREYLQEPFIFCSCDTLTPNPIPSPDHNWMAYAEVVDPEQYRTLVVNSINKNVKSILEKSQFQNGAFAYIGLAGIYNYKEFWEEMKAGGNESIDQGESYGLRVLLKYGISGYKMEWRDTGNLSALQKTRQELQEPNSPNILDKPGEAIWFVGEKVIKYSADKKFIENRVKRVNYLKGYVPEVLAYSENFYSYAKVKGEIFSEAVSLPRFKKLLTTCLKFWTLSNLPKENKNSFQNLCMSFYKDKTYKRVELFYKTFHRADGEELINGISIPSLKTILDQVDWNWLSKGLAGRFHGDFHFENILFSPLDEKFTFLDWRQDFEGDLEIGDIYYDLAKLKHGLIISHELILANHFNVEWSENNVKSDFYRKQILVECEQFFDNWLTENNFDVKKVNTLTALIYLNIAALHHDPYCQLLYNLGKSMLYNTITNGK